MELREFKVEPEQCVCCKPKSTDKVTKAYARGIRDEQNRIINLLPKDLRFWIGNKAYDKLIALIKGEGKRQKDNETVVLLTGRDYDQLSDAVKGEGEN